MAGRRAGWLALRCVNEKWPVDVSWWFDRTLTPGMLQCYSGHAGKLKLRSQWWSWSSLCLSFSWDLCPVCALKLATPPWWPCRLSTSTASRPRAVAPLRQFEWVASVVRRAWISQVLIILNLSVAFSDLLPVMMLVAFTLVGGNLTWRDFRAFFSHGFSHVFFQWFCLEGPWPLKFCRLKPRHFATNCQGFMPLKEYVDSRFSTPDEMARFKSVQWIIGYVLGMALLARFWHLPVSIWPVSQTRFSVRDFFGKGKIAQLFFPGHWSSVCINFRCERTDILYTRCAWAAWAAWAWILPAEHFFELWEEEWEEEEEFIENQFLICCFRTKAPNLLACVLMVTQILHVDGSLLCCFFLYGSHISHLDHHRSLQLLSCRCDTSCIPTWKRLCT